MVDLQRSEDSQVYENDAFEGDANKRRASLTPAQKADAEADAEQYEQEEEPEMLPASFRSLYR